MENVKIKMEPNSIKIEPGSTHRLTSLKLPRDLKLGGSKAKVVRPNLNVVRNKRLDVAPATSSSNLRGRGRGRGGRDRGALRGRAATTVQSYGLFSEGIADTMAKRRSMYSDRFREAKDVDAAKIMEKPTFDKNTEWKVDKVEEEEILRDLVYVKLNPDEMDVRNDQEPIMLPVYKPAEQTPVTKVEAIIKSEEKFLQNGIEEKKLLEAQEKLLLFKFPDSLPGLGPSKEPEPRANTSTSNGIDGKNLENDKTQKQLSNKCTLSDLNEGLLGKIVIYKSGKTKLLIGNSRFDVEIGPDAGFLQDVMSVPINISEKSGDMINLGSLEGNIIVTPEWDKLLQSEQ